MILEQRWTTVDPEQYAREERLAGDAARFNEPEPSPGVGIVRPAAGRAEELLAVLEDERDTHPEEPLWHGVRSMVADDRAVRIEFVERGVPRLLPVAGSSVSVSCHHYHESGAREGRVRNPRRCPERSSRRSSTEPIR